MYGIVIPHLVILNNFNLIIRKEKWLTDDVGQNYLLNIIVSRAF